MGRRGVDEGAVAVEDQGGEGLAGQEKRVHVVA
jgi:hypothetical protein